MEKIEKKIKKILRKVVKIKDFDNEDNLEEMGVTSLNMLLVIPNIELTFDVEIPSEDLTRENFITIKAMANLVNKLQKA